MIGKLVIAGAVGALIGAGLVGAVVATAAPEFHTFGNRFKPLAYADLTPEQKAFADKEIAAGRNPSPPNRPLQHLPAQPPICGAVASARRLSALQVADAAQAQGNREHADGALLGRPVCLVFAPPAGARRRPEPRLHRRHGGRRAARQHVAGRGDDVRFHAPAPVDPPGERRQLQGHGGPLRRTRHRRDRRLDRPLHRPHHAVRGRSLSRAAGAPDEVNRPM